jgi:hypothetical protein
MLCVFVCYATVHVVKSVEVWALAYSALLWLRESCALGGRADTTYTVCVCGNRGRLESSGGKCHVACMLLAVPMCNHVWDLSLYGRARVWFNSRLGIVSNLLATHVTVPGW